MMANTYNPNYSEGEGRQIVVSLNKVSKTLSEKQTKN
jgi:hypothetical protein